MSPQNSNQGILNRFGAFTLRFEKNKTVSGITRGLINLIPIVLIGSIFLAITNLPIPGFHEALDGATIGGWTLITNVVTFATEDIIAIAALISISFSLAAQNSFLQKHEISPFFPMFTALSCYVVLLVWDPLGFASTPAGESPQVVFTNPGRNGVFAALFVSVVAAKLFVAFARLWHRLPLSRGRIIGSQQQVRMAIRAVFPISCTLVCFLGLRFLLNGISGNTEIEERFTEFVSGIANNGSLPAVILSVLMMQLLWFFGAHGSNTIQSYMEQNTTGALIGETTSTYDLTTMFTNPDFYSVFVDMGGTGTGIALLLALAVFGSVGRGKELAKISVFPVAFNINETLLFGVPIVLSPFSVIPFVIAPLITVTAAYGAFSFGIVPPMVHYVEWTTPILFSGYMSTGSIAGTLLQLGCVGLSFLVYAPFVIVAKRVRENHQLQLFETFKQKASCAANNEELSLLQRDDDIADMARDFITELHLFFESKEIPFHMVFQPKTDAQGRVVGAEALLRGTHPLYGPVPPDVLIELTDEAFLTTETGRWIATESLEEFARWRESGLTELVLSINLNPHHLYLDHDFPEFLKAEMERLKIEPARVELEITEHIAVHASSGVLDMFRRLRALGVELSIDDMGMGYSSLTYISDFGVGVVKIDVSLVDKVTVDTQQQEIVRSVLELAKQINLAVIVEGVETKEQVEVLAQLGCRYFQGYYFSKPLLPDEFISFVEEHGTAHIEHE